jgi:hypothetical protein
MYKLVKNEKGGIACIYRIYDNTSIPVNADNTDYQEYLKWVALGNEPLPAENT